MLLSLVCVFKQTTSFVFIQKKRRRRYAKIDRFFLVCFPLMFVGFNVAYWIYYFSFNPMNMFSDIISQENEGSSTVTTEEQAFVPTTMSPDVTTSFN